MEDSNKVSHLESASSSVAGDEAERRAAEEMKDKRKSDELHFSIRKSWDGRDTAEDLEIKLTFSRRTSARRLGSGRGRSASDLDSRDVRLEEKSEKGGESGETNKLTRKEEDDEEDEDEVDADGLVIRVDAPFFNEPHVGEEIPPGSVDKLWEYEVVEVFFLGIDNKYLEIELAPRGHYLVLLLDGHGNILQYQLPLNFYETVIEGNRWFGEAIIPYNYLPSPINKFNAYAIHKSPPHRQYMALFPTPTHKYPGPNFHRLGYFQSIQLDHLLPPSLRSPASRSHSPLK